MSSVNWPRRVLSVLLALSLTLGVMGRAPPSIVAGVNVSSVAAMGNGGMAGCDGCINSGDTGKGMGIASCQGGVCVVLPGLVPTSVGIVSLTRDAFLPVTSTATSGVSPRPDHPPPIAASLA
jgi:hypothetical protein